MSRIGKMPITIPAGVEYRLDGNVVTVKGKKGELKQEIDLTGISLNLEGNILTVSRASDAPDHRSKHGLYRALIQNMVVGVSEGFTKGNGGCRSWLPSKCNRSNVGISAWVFTSNRF